MKVPYCMLHRDSPICLVWVDQFDTLTDVRDKYAKHTGFDIKDLKVHTFGHNILDLGDKNDRTFLSPSIDT